MTAWQHVPAGQLPMWVSDYGHVKLCCVADPDDEDHRELLRHFAERLKETRRDVFAALRSVEFARPIPWVSLVFHEVPPSMGQLWEQQVERYLALLPWPEFGRFADAEHKLRVKIQCGGEINTIYALNDAVVEDITCELNGQWRRKP